MDEVVKTLEFPVLPSFLSTAIKADRLRSIAAAAAKEKEEAGSIHSSSSALAYSQDYYIHISIYIIMGCAGPDWRESARGERFLYLFFSSPRRSILLAAGGNNDGSE